jgi:hypothetical protein
VVGGGLVLAGIAIGVGLFVWTVAGFMKTDATVPADGRPHAVLLEPGEDKMLWVHEYDAARCSIVDRATGTEVDRSPVTGSFTRSTGRDEWVGDLRFDSGSGQLEVSCDRSGGPAQIGPAPRIGAFVGGIFAMILIPLTLGGIGLVVLIVTGVLFATGSPRKPQPAPSYGPTPGAPPPGNQPR